MRVAINGISLSTVITTLRAGRFTQAERNRSDPVLKQPLKTARTRIRLVASRGCKMILDKDEEIDRLQSVLRQIVAMVELPSVSKKTIGDYAKAALNVSYRLFNERPRT